MTGLDIKTITTEFIALAGIDAEEARACEQTVIEAKKKTERLTGEKSLTQEQLESLEHLAACEAVYEYALARCAGDRTVISQNGKAGERQDSLSRADAAAMLRQEAYNRVSGLLKDRDFVFCLTEG